MKRIWVASLFVTLLICQYRIHYKNTLKLDHEVVNAGRAVLDFGQFKLMNISLGYNYRTGQNCYTTRQSLSYVPNRIWHDGSYCVLHPSMVWYTSKRLKGELRAFVDFLGRMAMNDYEEFDHHVWLLVAKASEVKLVYDDVSSYKEVESRPWEELFSTLDSGYRLMWYQGAKKRIPFMLTGVDTGNFNDWWLNTLNRTPDQKNKWFGNYAGALNTLVTLPSTLRIFDFFDFWGKSDVDFDTKDPRTREHGDLFPVRRMVEQKKVVFGCYCSLDSDTVTKNLFHMASTYINNMEYYCNKTVRINSLKSGFLFSPMQQFPGAMVLGWLGLFSSAEVKSFTKYYYEYPYGFRLWRWGDQQYVFLTSAMFSMDAETDILIDHTVPVCQHTSLAGWETWQKHHDQLKNSIKRPPEYAEGKFPKIPLVNFISDD